MTHDDVRAITMAMPDVVEVDHHGKRAFRVPRRQIATLWDEATLNVMLDEDGVRSACARWAQACSERWWGKRLAAVAVDLRVVDAAVVRELLADAWERGTGRPLGAAESLD